jgi:hypothetical protein
MMVLLSNTMNELARKSQADFGLIVGRSREHISKWSPDTFLTQERIQNEILGDFIPLNCLPHLLLPLPF